MKNTTDPEWIRGFQRNLVFVHKLEEALSQESFKRVCEFTNEYRMKKRRYGYRVQDQEEVEKQMIPLLVAFDQNILSAFKEILTADVPDKSLRRTSNGTNVMDDPDVECGPKKSGHPPTKSTTSDPIQLEAAHHHTPKHKGMIACGKSVGLEDVPKLTLNYSSHPKRRRRQRPMVEPIISNGTHCDNVNGGDSSEPKKRKDCDKHVLGEKQDEHIVHVRRVRRPSKKYLDDATTKREPVPLDTNRTLNRSCTVDGNNAPMLKFEDRHQLHNEKRKSMPPTALELCTNDVQKAKAVAFLVNLSKLGDPSLHECIKNILQLFRDKKLPSYYANKCICMLLETHKKLLTEFCKLTEFQWLTEVNTRSYNGGCLGLRDRAFNQYTYIEEAARNHKLCALEKHVPTLEAKNICKHILNATISLDTQLHKDLLEEKQFGDSLKAKLKGNKNYRWWPGCTLKNLTPNIGSKFQVSKEKSLGDNDAAPHVNFKFDARAAKFLADHLVSKDQTTTIDSQQNELISQATSSMRGLELVLSRFWLETIGTFESKLSAVKKMLLELPEDPPK